MSSLALLLLLALAAGCAKAPGPPAGELSLPPTGSPPADVVFVLVDALRADRLGAYGHRGCLTPVMDEIAAEGVTFEQAVSAAPWTVPSVASLFTGVYPAVHRTYEYTIFEAMSQGEVGTITALPGEFQTLAETFRDAGYDTAGFVANRFLVAPFGFAQGFEHYDDSLGGRKTGRGAVINEALGRWLETRPAGRPLFLYLHYMDVHGPYDAAPRFTDPLVAAVEAMPESRRHALSDAHYANLNLYLKAPPAGSTGLGRFQRLRRYREYWVARYEAGVAEMDHYLAGLRELLQRHGLWSRALLVLTADHGEALCEHGLWEHGESLLQTDLHVPLLVRWPGVLPAGVRVGGPASLLDLPPTLADLLRLPATSGFQGRSLLPRLAGGEEGDPAPRYAEAVKLWPFSHLRQETLLQGRWKLIRFSRASPTRGRPLERFALFDLQVDPGEASDRSRDRPEVVKALTGPLQSLSDENWRLRERVAGQRVGFDERTREALSELGYVERDTGAPAND